MISSLIQIFDLKVIAFQSVTKQFPVHYDVLSLDLKVFVHVSYWQPADRFNMNIQGAVWCCVFNCTVLSVHE